MWNMPGSLLVDQHLPPLQQKYDSNQCCNGLEALDLISLAGATTAMAGMMEHFVVCVYMCSHGEWFLFYGSKQIR